MQLSISFIRLLFLALCVLFLTTYTASGASEEMYYTKMAIGAISGLIFGCALISLDAFFKRFDLRTFNIAVIGLFFGYLMGEAILLLFQSVMDIAFVDLSPQTFVLLRIGFFLFSCYFGMVMTARAADDLYISIPFIRFQSNVQKKKEIVLDSSILLDSRVIDLAGSGLMDQHLIIPRFLIKDFQELSENVEEMIKSKAKRALDVINKLEMMPSLELVYSDVDFPEIKDPMTKLVKLARILDANILTADSNRIQQSSIEGVRIINLHTLSSALKPLAQMGEFINIKIQRYGKEPRQGVGYLDDGTMVVVNGGAEFIGEGIRAQVLSVKHTASGRMIFCNALEGSDLYLETSLSMASNEGDASTKSYFAL